ncbi:CHRD domain-containing protein [Reyranella sp.]|uniref:CHRD domain-containing protein n=1 Tax=Reyranella sp. TaxID=1929291 RepID=UPI003BA8956C
MSAVVRPVLVLGLLLAASCSFYMGEPRVPKTELRATLYGANEVPPTQSRASGWFEATYRPSTKVLEYRMNLVGLSSPMTMGYLQGPAPMDPNGPRGAPINIPIYDYTIRDGVTLTDEQAAEVLAGRWSVTILTTQYPDGEIRGRILPVAQ